MFVEHQCSQLEEMDAFNANSTREQASQPISSLEHIALRCENLDYLAACRNVAQAHLNMQGITTRFRWRTLVCTSAERHVLTAHAHAIPVDHQARPWKCEWRGVGRGPWQFDPLREKSDSDFGSALPTLAVDVNILPHGLFARPSELLKSIACRKSNEVAMPCLRNVANVVRAGEHQPIDLGQLEKRMITVLIAARMRSSANYSASSLNGHPASALA